MNDSTKILVVGWGGTVIVAVLVGICSFAPVAVCHHDGRLDHIDLAQTWRVRFQPAENRTVILGVCKKCGRVTDIEQQGPGIYMHLPLAGSPLYDEAIASSVENEAADEGKPKKLSY